jgi:hypothetical protein
MGRFFRFAMRWQWQWGWLGLVAVALMAPMKAGALPRTWIGGNTSWVDGGSPANWNPADEPDADDEAIFNTANSVSLGSSNTIQALTLSGGIDLSTNGHLLSVDGLVQLAGAGTNLFVQGAASSLDADQVTINSGGALELFGGTLTLDEEVGNGVLTINAGGTLAGNGVVHLVDNPFPATRVLTNNGTLTAVSRPLIVTLPPPTGTLQINGGGIFARIDLDGTTETGVVNVSRNQTLDINLPLFDSFQGTLTLAQNSILDIAAAWTLAGGTLNADNGFAGGIPGIPAGKSTVAGGQLTQTGGTISVVDTDGVLQFDAPFTMTGGTLSTNGLVIFNADATISAGANLARTTATSSLTVKSGRIVTINQLNFDLDGQGTSTNVITVEDGGSLVVNTTDYDPDSLINRFDGVFHLNGGDVTVTTSDPAFVMDGTLNFDRVSQSLIPVWSGEPLQIGNDVGNLDAQVHVTASGAANGFRTSRVDAPIRFRSDAALVVAEGAILGLNNTVDFDTVNGANHASFTGSGELSFSGQVNVNEAVTLDMPGGTIDLDGVDNVGDAVNVNAPLVVNAAVVRSFGRSNAVGINSLNIDARTVGHTGRLTVNLPGLDDSWSLNPAGVLNLSAPNGGATLLAGNDAILNGTLNVTGAVGFEARVTIGGTVEIPSGNSLILAGGTLAKPNRLEGGTINGQNFFVSSGRALHGFGAIGASIDFNGTATLRADGGLLTIDGVTDVGEIGASNSGVLNVVSAWNSSGADAVVLHGGELRGGTLTIGNAAGVAGRGLLSARVINNQRIVANGGTLVVETAVNNNDWDGQGNTGLLLADSLSTLELRDNATFGFLGTVRADSGGKVVTNGFALDFNSGATLALNQGTYQSTHSTDLGGQTMVGAGLDSVIDVQNNRFLTFEDTSTTLLTGNLRLVNNNINIDPLASFGGTGALIIPSGSHLSAKANANINVLLRNEGVLRPAGFDTVGRVDLKDYQQSLTGELFVEITGTSLNQFDRLLVNGDAILGGYLNIDIDGGFVPVVGNSFNILSTTGIRSGEFTTVDFSGMPAGLTMHLNYLPNAVQLQVVNTPVFTADFDNDGDVDGTDLSIWEAALHLNQLGDADGDGDSDGGDFLAWQRQFGNVPVELVAMAVPEPSTQLLVCLGAAGELLAHRRSPRTQSILHRVRARRPA